MADVDISAEAVDALRRDLLNPEYRGPAQHLRGWDSLDALHDSAEATLRALRARATQAEAERDAARAALARWQHYGCPDCNGDCASANPPVACCIMQETRAALGGAA